MFLLHLCQLSPQFGGGVEYAQSQHDCVAENLIYHVIDFMRRIVLSCRLQPLRQAQHFKRHDFAYLAAGKVGEDVQLKAADNAPRMVGLPFVGLGRLVGVPFSGNGLKRVIHLLCLPLRLVLPKVRPSMPTKATTVRKTGNI